MALNHDQVPVVDGVPKVLARLQKGETRDEAKRIAMRIFGRQLTKWWLVRIAALLIVGSPLLLIGFFAANNLVGAIVGPPAIWNRPSRTPPPEDLVGDYVESKRQLDREMGELPATLSLNADGTMVAKGLPFDQYPGYCIVSGEGRWGVTNDGSAKVNLYGLSIASGGTCKPENYSYIELAGRSKPYKLYWVVGDPDSGTGVYLVKK